MIWSNSTISAQRFSETGGQEVYAAAHVTGIDCYIEQLQPELAQFWDSSGTMRVHRCVTDEVVDIQETDKVTDQNSTVYTVRAAQHFKDNTDVENHTELILISAYDKV